MIDSQILQVALSFGFPAWAVVVWAAAVKVTSLIRELADQLQRHHSDNEKRLSLLEDTVRRLDLLVEKTDNRLRELERNR
jgi:hypothetical protein